MALDLDVEEALIERGVRPSELRVLRSSELISAANSIFSRKVEGQALAVSTQGGQLELALGSQIATANIDAIAITNKRGEPPTVLYLKQGEPVFDALQVKAPWRIYADVASSLRYRHAFSMTSATFDNRDYLNLRVSTHTLPIPHYTSSYAGAPVPISEVADHLRKRLQRPPLVYHPYDAPGPWYLFNISGAEIRLGEMPNGELGIEAAFGSQSSFEKGIGRLEGWSDLSIDRRSRIIDTTFDSPVDMLSFVKDIYGIEPGEIKIATGWTSTFDPRPPTEIRAYQPPFGHLE